MILRSVRHSKSQQALGTSPPSRRGIPLRMCPCASIHRMRCLAARGPAIDRAHPAPPTPFRAAAECRDTPEVVSRKAKGPDPFGIRASEDRVGRECLGASLARIRQTPVPIGTMNAHARHRTHGRAPRALRQHRCGTHERSRALGGPGAGDSAQEVHSGAFQSRCALRGGREQGL